MGWFRGERRLGAWLALVALVLQLGLSFGHIHVQVGGHQPELAAAPEASHTDGDPEHRDGDNRQHCPACAILSLLAGTLVGADLAWSVPVSRTAEALIPAAETARPESIRGAFRARAPPLS